MSECVSLIIWPTTANYSLISLWFYVLCQKLQKCYNDISVLKRTYLYNHWFKSYELKSIRKPRRSMLLHLYNAKCDSYAVKCYITSNPKLPNIATLLEPTIACRTKVNGWYFRQTAQFDQALKRASSVGIAWWSVGAFLEENVCWALSAYWSTSGIILYVILQMYA